MDVRLVNMPFARLEAPNLGLEQLKSVAEGSLGALAEVRVEYVNHDFGAAFGIEDYTRLALDDASLYSGFGDWLFREVAFKNIAGNAEQYLARYGRQIGEAFCRDVRPGGRMSPEALRQALSQIIDARQLDRADVVGFSSSFAQTIPSLAMARMLRERNPGQLILLGGANCEGVMGRALARVVQNIDLIFSGPALVAFPAVIERFLNAPGERVDDIDGVMQCAASRAFTMARAPTSRALYGQDLSIDTPVPVDFDGFMHSTERFPRGELEVSLTFETSRGCWWGQRAHCTFCGLNGASMAYRAMPGAMARQVISDLVERYAPEVRLFDCVDNIMAKEYVGEVFEGLRFGPDISIFYETKSDLREEEVGVLARAGVKRIQPGIESIITSTLKLMRKGVTAFHNVRLLKSCLFHEVHPAWSILVGFPGEDAQTFEIYKKILPNLFHLQPPMGVVAVRYDRFSPYHSNPSEFGLDLAPADYYKYCYPYEQDIINDMAYYFQNINIDATYYGPLFDGLGEVSLLVKQWQAAWDEGVARPRLDLRRDALGGLVTDTRSGTAIETRLSSMSVALLDQLSEPRDLSWVEQHHPGELAKLRSANLVFEERGRALSLIVDGRGATGRVPEMAAVQAV